MADALNEILIRLRTDLAPLVQGFKQGERSIQGFVSSARGQLLTLSASFAGAVLAARSLTNAITENFRQARELAAVSGLSVEAADNLADTFELLGFDANALSTAMFTMGRQIETGGEALRKLGISSLDSAGALKAEGELFLELRDRISAMGSASERSAALVEVFGRAGRTLAPAFALSREEFQRLLDKGSQLSRWAEDMHARAGRLTIATNELAQSWKGLKIELGDLIATPTAGFFDRLSGALRNIRQGFTTRELLQISEAELDRLGLVGRLTGQEERIRRQIELYRELIREAERAASLAARAAQPTPEPAGPPPRNPSERLAEILRGPGVDVVVPPGGLELPQVKMPPNFEQVMDEVRRMFQPGPAEQQPGSVSERLRSIGEEARTLSTQLDPATREMLLLDNAMARIRREADAFGSSFDRIAAETDAVKDAMRRMIAEGVGPAELEFRILQTRLQGLTETAEVRQAFEEVFGAVRRGMSETVTGVLRGTQTMEEGFRRMGQNVALSLVETIVNRALRQIQEAIWRVIEDMITMQSASAGGGGFLGTITGAIGGFFGGGAPSGGGGSFIGPPQFAQHGGIFTRPTLTVVGERGRGAFAQPEAVIPLERLPDFLSLLPAAAGPEAQEILPETIREEVREILRLVQRPARQRAAGFMPTHESLQFAPPVFMQEGGIVTRPIVAGEAGPEAILPLDRFADFVPDAVGRGKREPVVQQINNFMPGLPETVRRELYQMLPEIEKLAVNAVLAASDRGGAMARTMGRRGR